MQMICATCRWWAARQPDGECQRYPPVLLPLWVQGDSGPVPHVIHDRPRTNAGDGCGEWTENPRERWP